MNYKNYLKQPVKMSGNSKITNTSEETSITQLGHKGTNAIPNPTLDLWICKTCNWNGTKDELEWDTVETCMGSDKIEICPNCSSMEVILNR